MKKISAALLLAIGSFSAQAFDFRTGSLVLPDRVELAIHAAIEAECFTKTHQFNSLDLKSFEIQEVRVADGYREKRYHLLFDVNYKKMTGAQKDRVEVLVVDQLEDRSGQLQTYVVELKTTACE